MRPVKLLAVVLCVLASQMHGLSHAEDLGYSFFREVTAVSQKCASGKTTSEAISCYVRAAPKKCESKVHDVFAQRDEARQAAQRALYFCVASCLDAGFFSRTLGECARDLK